MVVLYSTAGLKHPAARRSSFVCQFLEGNNRLKFRSNIPLLLPSLLSFFHADSMQKGGYFKLVLASIAPVISIGVIFAAAAAATTHHRRRKHKEMWKDQTVVPLLDRSESGRVGRIERFSNYVARQMGFGDVSECPHLCKLACEHLKRSKGCESNIFEYLANETNAGELYVKLVEEFERCILSYFAFHWSHASLMISQILSVDSDRKKLKDFVMAATRKMRFDRVSRDLKVTSTFSTLLEEMKAIGGVALNGDSNSTDVMMPVAHSQRSPVLLLMGGGMGAGKSTVLKDILKQPFWAEAAANAVVVEADAFKESDVIYRALSSKGRHEDMLQTAELVHQSSTNAASSLLVTALNEGRDVIMDGTLSWEPFVEQTIAMAKNVHKHRYRMGIGYQIAEDGTTTENYWEKVEEEEGGGGQEKELGDQGHSRIKPYRIELVGVICDAYLAVVRGIRRAIDTGRAVRVKSQLKSHKRFATAFPRYCQLVDNAKLYCTNAAGGPPRLIAWKDGHNKLLVDPDEISCLTLVSNLNDDADSIYELYPSQPGYTYQPGSIWNDIVLLPSRSTIQQELKSVAQRIEKSDSPKEV